MNGFVENICRKVYEEKRGIITDPDQIKQCYITDDFPKAIVENTEGRKEYRIYMDFDKKNEFPKVKLNLPKFDFSHLTETVRNMNSAFENMIKDTQEQKDKDNAMAMEFTKCIGELLRKNGVVPKITEYTHESVKENSIEQLYGVSIEELDFSEHDKVFEDKIAKLQEEVGKLNQDNMRLERKCVTKDDEIYRLKKDYETVSELLGKYQQENESLKKRVVELENFSCQAEQETESLVEKLNQRIVKLEKSRSEWIDRTVEWQQKCEKLESKETEICEKEPKVSSSAPSIEWYENRHQSDCIEINRLNTTIDVLIHKVEYLRQFAGLE